LHELLRVRSISALTGPSRSFIRPKSNTHAAKLAVKLPVHHGGIQVAVRWVIHTLQRYPETAIFLTLVVGFAIGGIKPGKFSLGNGGLNTTLLNK
jgi:hypothetical protein